MKNIALKVTAFTGLFALAISCSSHDELLVESQPSAHSAVSKEASTVKTYKIRYGLLSKIGTKLLSGNYDVGSFIATDTTKGGCRWVRYGIYSDNLGGITLRT